MNFLITKRNTLIATALFAAGILGLTACANTPASGTTATTPESMASTVSPAPAASLPAFDSTRNTITVNSSEKVTVVPDIAQVVYAVRTEAKDAAACQTKNTEDVNKVIEQLKELGIAEASIQTSDYYMYPIYNYSNNTQRITGYEATTTLTVSDLPIDNLGNILTQSVKAGINNVQSVTYQSSKYDSGYQEALKLAVNSAKTKADALAEAGGCSLGSIAGIVENSNYSEVRYTDNALTAKVRNAASMKEESLADTGANIMPGEVDIEVHITVEYFIQ